MRSEHGRYSVSMFGEKRPFQCQNCQCALAKDPSADMHICKPYYFKRRSRASKVAKKEPIKCKVCCREFERQVEFVKKMSCKQSKIMVYYICRYVSPIDLDGYMQKFENTKAMIYNGKKLHIKREQAQIPNFRPIHLLWAASITLKMSAPKMYLFIFNLENLLDLIPFIPDTLVAITFGGAFVQIRRNVE